MYQAGVAAHRALAPLDLTIIGVYFLVVFGIGFYFSRKERTSEEYFLAGRDIGWFFIGASLFVSNISTEHFIGLSGTGASSGLPDIADPRLGVCSFLFAQQRIHHAAILGAAI